MNDRNLKWTKLLTDTDFIQQKKTGFLKWNFKRRKPFYNFSGSLL